MNVLSEIRSIFRKHYFSKALETTLKQIEKDVEKVLSPLLAHLQTFPKKPNVTEFDDPAIETYLLEVAEWEKELYRRIQHPENYVCWSRKKLEDDVVSLGQLRAGNIGRIWDAGQAYRLLLLLGKAPTFKTRKEAFAWAEKNICKFLTSVESREELFQPSTEEKKGST